MELIRINDNKLKIMLTSSDMKNYELDVQKLSCGTEETRRAFRNILHDAGVCSEAEDGKDKIYIQYYPSREGGCEMFVTRLALLAGKDGTESTARTELLQENAALSGGMQLLSQEQRLTKHHSAHDKSASRQEIGHLTFRFDSLPQLLLACHRTLAANVLTSAASSEAYRDESNRFYLLLNLSKSGDDGEHGAAQRIRRILAEFGSALPHADICAYLREHGDPLCRKDALRTLGGLC